MPVPSPVRPLAVLLLLAVGCPRPAEPPDIASSAPPAGRLRPGAPTLHRLGRAQAHRHPFELTAGEYLHLVVEQHGLDVVISLFGPGPQRLFDVDTPTGSRSDEHVVLLADRTGLYWAEVRPFDPSAAEGTYGLRVAALRQATAGDRLHARAESAFARARELVDRTPGTFSRPAADLYLEAARAWQEVGNGPRQADALLRLGRLERAAGHPREAIRFFEQALPLRPARELPRDRAVLLTDLGAAHRDLGDLGAARQCFEEAVRLHGRAGFPQGQANALLNLGALEERQGRVLEALDHLRQARERLRGQDFHTTEVMILNEIGSLYTALGETERALEHHRQALALLRPERHRALWADTLDFLGHAWLEAGDLNAAAGAYEQALELRKQQANPRAEAVSFAGLGLVSERRGETAQAQALYQRALRIFEEQEDLMAAVITRNNLGWLHLRAGQPARALDLFQQVLDQSGGLQGSPLRVAALSGMARAEQKRGDLEAAERRIRSALSVIEAFRQEAPHSDLRTSYLASRQDDYALLIELLMEQHRRRPGAGLDAQALGISEQSRARQLLDTLAGEEMRPASPWVASARAPRPLTLPEIQRQVLDRDTVLLEIHLGSPRSYLWVVTHDGLRSFPLPDRAVLESAARRAWERLADSHRPTATAAAQLAVADLSWKLLGPAAPLPAARRLVVVTSGALQYIPFAVLPEPSPHGPDATAPPLVVGHEIVHLPSASALAVLRRQAAGRTPPPGLLAVVADPVFHRDDERLRGRTGPAAERAAPWDLGLPRLERLPYARQEAEAILTLAAGRPARHFLGFEASRQLVLSGELARYRILHFATHGWLDTRHPELSSLLLSRFDTAGRPQDGRLHMREIYGLALPADLVVLSGCQTALGREIEGEGLVGLTRGFLYAGARSVLVSVWSVGDRSTAELMERFYHGLLVDGLPPAAALRQAQIALLGEERWSAPFHWAGFELQGDWAADLPQTSTPRPVRQIRLHAFPSSSSCLDEAPGSTGGPPPRRSHALSGHDRRQDLAGRATHIPGGPHLQGRRHRPGRCRRGADTASADRLGRTPPMSCGRSLPAPSSALPASSGNGVHGETGAYLHPPLDPDEALAAVLHEIFPEPHLNDLGWRAARGRQRYLGPMEGVDPGLLSETGWGVVFPAGLDPEVREALRPLLDLRRQQAGGRYRELTWNGEDKPLFLARHGAGPGPVDPRNLPYYLLLVGGPEEIPFDFQYQIDVQHAVGRLGFDGLRSHEDYACYARSVVRAETGAPALPRRVTLFAPRTSGDSATELTHDHLIRPLTRELVERLAVRPAGWTIEPVLGPGATRKRLLELLARDRPALLLTAGHGVGFLPGDPRQARTQGALLCQDWKGPGQGLSADDYVSADDLPDDSEEAAPAGLIAFHFACYSAATPAANNFAHRSSQESGSLAPASFLARLPQRLLSHPGGGALAVVGHVDRAWGYSFYWPLAGEQLQVFASAFLRLLEGFPIGWALELFNQRYAELASDLLPRTRRPGQPELLHPAAFWTAMLDARNYVILGDPAVRLDPLERRRS